MSASEVDPKRNEKMERLNKNAKKNANVLFDPNAIVTGILKSIHSDPDLKG